MGGPENLKGGSVRPSIRPSVRSTLAQPIKSVCSYFLPIGSPVHPEGGRSNWSCELPSLITLDQLERDKIYPGVSVRFKPRERQQKFGQSNTRTREAKHCALACNQICIQNLFSRPCHMSWHAKFMLPTSTYTKYVIVTLPHAMVCKIYVADLVSYKICDRHLAACPGMQNLCCRPRLMQNMRSPPCRMS